jgi:hypothetical protein
LKSDESFDFGLLSGNVGVGAPDFHNRIDAVGVLNANKTSWVSGSNYGTRKDLIREMLGAGYPVHVGGKGWDTDTATEIKMNLVALMSCIAQWELPDLGVYRPALSTTNSPLLKFHGEIRGGIDFLRNYKFCLVIENDSRYLSEKLFQALEAGCVPLYYGPKLGYFGVPDGVALNLNDYRGRNLNPYLTNSVKQAPILAAGRAFLSDQRRQQYWSHRSGLDRLFQRMRRYLDHS